MDKKVKVAVTGAAGQVAYSLVFRIASGEVFGPNVGVELSLVDIEPALSKVEAVKMELCDCAFKTLLSVSVSSSPEEGFAGCDWLLLVGASPRKQGMERNDLLRVNGSIFSEQGKAIGKVCPAGAKILVVGNPCNTNAWIARRAAGAAGDKMFFCALTMLDQNRATSLLAQKAGVATAEVKGVIIWGNHSATQYPDVSHATIAGKPAGEVIADRAWLENEFISAVQNRGAEIIKAKGSSSSASAANAVIDTVKLLGCDTGDYFSLAVPSVGSYGVPEGIVYSFPVRPKNGSWEVVEGLEISGFSRARMDATLSELVAEKDAVS